MILLGLAACTQVVQFPPDLYPAETGFDTATPRDTDPPVPPATIRATIDEPTISYGCNQAGTAILASFRTRGWAGGARVLLVDGAGVRVEQHPFVLEESDTTGAWDRYALGPLADEAAVPEPGVSTGFTCGTTDVGATWVLWTVERSGAPADCAVWGPAPLEAIHALAAVAPTVPPLCRDLGASP